MPRRRAPPPRPARSGPRPNRFRWCNSPPAMSISSGSSPFPARDRYEPLPTTRKGTDVAGAATAVSNEGGSPGGRAHWPLTRIRGAGRTRSAPAEGVSISSQIVRSEDPGQVGVAEPAVRIDLGADAAELVEAGIERAEPAGVERMQLAPVRPAVHRGHDGLEPVEVFLVGQAGVLVDGDVSGLPAVAGGEPDVVGRRHPHLDREHDRIVQAGNGTAQFGDHLAQ